VDDMPAQKGEENTQQAIVADRDVAGGFTREALGEDDVAVE
jgi:hypothetical protein